MKQLSTFTISCGVLVALGIFSAIPVNSQNPIPAVAAVNEQYHIVSAQLPNSRFKADAELERELNALAAAGWKVRAANQTAIILAR
jgi:hypothetical protein